MIENSAFQRALLLPQDLMQTESLQDKKKMTDDLFQPAVSKPVSRDNKMADSHTWSQQSLPNVPESMPMVFSSNNSQSSIKLSEQEQKINQEGHELEVLRHKYAKLEGILGIKDKEISALQVQISHSAQKEANKKIKSTKAKAKKLKDTNNLKKELEKSSKKIKELLAHIEKTRQAKQSQNEHIRQIILFNQQKIGQQINILTRQIASFIVENNLLKYQLLLANNACQQFGHLQEQAVEFIQRQNSNNAQLPSRQAQANQMPVAPKRTAEQAELKTSNQSPLKKAKVGVKKKS